MNAQRSPTTAPRARKRGHGEGSIYQRPDGRWVGTIRLGYKPDGRPDRPKVYGRTRGEVQKGLRELRRRQEEGLRVDPALERQTLATFLEQWLEVTAATVRPRTLERYQEVVRGHLVPALGGQRLASLRPEALQRLYARKLAAGLAPRTVVKIHVVLHRALAMALRWGYVLRNVADAVDRPAVPQHHVQPPGPAELAALVDRSAAAGDRLAALWALAIHTGCRQGELLGLSWADVDLDAGTLTVRRTLTRVRACVPQFGDPKSPTSRRTLSLPEEALAALRAHRARQNQERLAAGRTWADHGLVFVTHVGTPLLQRNVIRDFKAALARAGLPRAIRFHDLRHAHATLMLRAGVPLKVASGRLGHGSIGITADLYQHLAQDLDADAAARAQRALRGVRP
jgi:integrase